MRKYNKVAINTGLLTNLKSCSEYIQETMDLLPKMVEILPKLKDIKSKDELSDEVKAVMQRSSELVVLVEITKSLELKEKRGK